MQPLRMVNPQRIRGLAYDWLKSGNELRVLPQKNVLRLGTKTYQPQTDTEHRNASRLCFAFNSCRIRSYSRTTGFFLERMKSEVCSIAALDVELMKRRRVEWVEDWPAGCAAAQQPPYAGWLQTHDKHRKVPPSNDL